MTAFEAGTWLHPIADMVEQLTVTTSTLGIVQQIEDAQQFASLGLWHWRVGSECKSPMPSAPVRYSLTRPWSTTLGRLGDLFPGRSARP